MKAIVSSAICPLKSAPQLDCELQDEALLGMEVEILSDVVDGWCLIKTHYNYEGYAPADMLVMDETAVQTWENAKKMVVCKSCCDILNVPKVQGWQVATADRGAIVAIADNEKTDTSCEAIPEGWVKVLLPDGKCGYTKCSYLCEYYKNPVFSLVKADGKISEENLRDALVASAMTYLGAHYRWGGKTMQGIDCSGLCSMAYMLNGLIIYRDAHIKEGFAMREITFAEIKKGDLMFFPGHVAMYIGDNKYIHSTARNGLDGVVISSLDEISPLYIESLAKGITAVGSAFC